MPNQPSLLSRLRAFTPAVLATLFLLLAAATASGKVWRQEPAQQQQQTPAQSTDAAQPQQPAAPADQQQQPVTQGDAQQQQTPAQGGDATQQQPAAVQPADAQQQPAAQGDAQQQPQPAAPGDGQQPAATGQNGQAGEQKQAEGEEPDESGQTPPPAKPSIDTSKKGKLGGLFGKKSASSKEKVTVVKIDPLAGIKDLNGDNLKEAGPFTEPDVDEKSVQGKRALEINEDELKKLLFKKELYLRGGYLNNSLNFNEHGKLIGKSPTGSFTLNYIEVTHISMSKHKITLECNRYGLHFMGNLDEDPDNNVQMIKLTPPKKKKPLIITIDREVVVKVPKAKTIKVPASKTAAGKNQPAKGTNAAPAAGPAPAQNSDGQAAPAGGDAAAQTPANAAENSTAANATPQPNNDGQKPSDNSSATTPQTGDKVAKAPTDAELENMTPEEQVKASIAATKPEERPADPNSVTHTFSPIHSSRVLRQALDQIFAVGQDSRYLSAMPDYWKHYYEAQDSRSFYRFKVPGMVHISQVDSRPALLKAIEPGSNQYAQDNAIVGIARYRALVGADGKVKEVAITVPIGFGLDELAVASIQHAAFKPAMKGGQPVMTAVDLYITFRIFSKMTSQTTKKSGEEEKDAADNKMQVAPPTRPGPFTLLHPYHPDAQQQSPAAQPAPGAGDAPTN